MNCLASVSRNEAGVQTWRRGNIAIHDGTRLGFLGQHDEFRDDETALDYVLRISGKEAWRAGKLGAAFGLTEEYLRRKMIALSGGYQMRVKVVGLFLQEPNLILLDEPTNYLDEEHIAWLKRYLLDYENAFILISHDIPFLNEVVNIIYHMENQELNRYVGDYDHFQEVYAVKKAQLEAQLDFDEYIFGADDDGDEEEGEGEAEREGIKRKAEGEEEEREGKGREIRSSMMISTMMA